MSQELYHKTVECVDSKIGSINTQGGVRPVFILELADIDTGELSIKFFNVELTKKGNHTVGRNSDFAKLYRLTIGENPSARFSRANKLLSHFHGHEFSITDEKSRDQHGKPFLKVTAIAPEYPVISDDWTTTGTLKMKSRKRSKNADSKGNEKAKVRQQVDKKKAKSRQKLGNAKTLQTPKTLGLEHDLDPINPYPIQHKNISHKPMPEREKFFNHVRHDDESVDEFYNRVIDLSLDSWLG